MGERSSIADMLYGSYIRYDRMYEMTKFAFYGKTDSESVNIFIDCYSMLRSLYKRGLNFQVEDSCVIASCLINLAIHIRAYFETRHHVSSKVYLIYGGARPLEAVVNFPYYNAKNILMEDSNFYLQELIADNLNVMKVLCPYLFDIFFIEDNGSEFMTIASNVIDMNQKSGNKDPNIIYSKDDMCYQLVAFKPYTFLYRPKKRLNMDNSWVVTKTTLYDAYRQGELELTTQLGTSLSVELFSMYLAIAGIRSRNLPSIKNANSAIKILESAVASNIIPNGYNHTIFYSNPNPFEIIFGETKVDPALLTNRYAAIDLKYQSMLYASSPKFILACSEIINLYDPDEVKNINNVYFQRYPLDLNRV